MPVGRAPLFEAGEDGFDVTVRAPSSSDPQWRQVYLDMLKADLCLFAYEILGLQVGPHMQEWGDIAAEHNRACVLAARDHSKSTFWSYAYPIWRAWSEPGCEVYIFSKTLEQAQEFLEIIIFGRANLRGIVDIPELMHLAPDPEDFRGQKDPRVRFTRSDVKLMNGSRIRVAGYGKAMRGRHPKYVICDDVLNDEDMHSDTVRRKNISYFQSAISHMPPPDGQLVVVGCVTEGTWVPTEQGLRQIGDLRPGPRQPQVLHELALRVSGREGLRPATKFWDNGVCPTKRVTLDSGHRIEGSHRHPLLVMAEDGLPTWRRCDAIQVGDWVAVKLGTERWGDAGDVTPDEAYLMGLWVAEGSVELPYRLTIASQDEEIHRFLAARPERWCPTRGGTHWRCSSKALIERWGKLGIAWETSASKRVPTAIMQGSRENAVAFLQGYFDGDGTIYEGRGSVQVSVGSVSEALIDDVQVLLSNLGVLAKKTVKGSPPTARATNGGRPLYVLRALGDHGRRLASFGFRLTRKRRALPLLGTARRLPHQGPLLRRAMESKPRRPRLDAGPPPFNASELQRGCVRADRLAAAAEWYRAHGADQGVCDTLAANAREDLHWIQVASIEDGEAYTVDFVIPDGHSFVSNGIVSHNTPYHINDLYGFLRQNPRYRFCRFPGILDHGKPTERALFPWRWTLDQLRAKKVEVGGVAFAREILCEPVTDDISIFPSVLFPPLFDKTLTLRPSLETIRANNWSVFFGVDIARSASVAADYFVIFVQAKDSDGTRYLVDIDATRGLPFKRQLERIEMLAARYQPDMIFIEANAMQQVYSDELIRTTDLPIKPFVTTAVNKYPLDKGVPSLRLLLENGKYVIPRGDDYSVAKTDEWIEQCTQFGFIDGKLQGIGDHDDLVMAWWFAEEATKAGGFSFAMGDDAGADEDDDAQGGDEEWESVLLGSGDDDSDDAL